MFLKAISKTLLYKCLLPVVVLLCLFHLVLCNRSSGSQCEGAEDGNFLQGGSMEAACESLWIVEDPNDEEPYPNYKFGANTGLPKNAVGGGLLITNNNPNRIEGKGENVFLYQSVFLKPGSYKFLADIKTSMGGEFIAGLVKPENAAYHYWLEFFLSKEKPARNEQLSTTHAKDLIGAFMGWGHGVPPAADGNFMDFANHKNVRANAEGIFKVEQDTTYQFIIQFGKSPTEPSEFKSGSYGPDGIGLDNLKIIKVEDNE